VTGVFVSEQFTPIKYTHKKKVRLQVARNPGAAVPYRIRRIPVIRRLLSLLLYYEYIDVQITCKILKIGRRGDFQEGIWDNSEKKNWKKVK
jgi:hypothetical protein